MTMVKCVLRQLERTGRLLVDLSTRSEPRKIKQTEDMIPIKVLETKHGKFGLYCAGRIGLYRADTFFTKEPETLKWIDAMPAPCVFWDIGANVGIYSLYAALRPGIQVLAFEPSPFNYFVLAKNMDINRLDGRISAYGIAFSDKTSLGRLDMTYMEIGDSCHSMAENREARRGSTVEFSAAAVVYTIDQFIKEFAPPFPAHIKIDVDGAESAIVEGGASTFADERLRSVLVEVDDANPKDRTIAPRLLSLGFKLVEKSHAPQYADSTTFNCIFRR